jgi:hypothetical protein
MSKERLSKLQLEILRYLNSTQCHNWDGNWKTYFDLQCDICRKYDINVEERNFLGITIHHPSKNFCVVLSQSIRNLWHKGLIEPRFKFQTPNHYCYYHKKCDGREPYEKEPCEDCFYMKKHPDAELYSVDEKCCFMYAHGTKGEERRKVRIEKMKITEKGKQLIAMKQKDLREK